MANGNRRGAAARAREDMLAPSIEDEQAAADDAWADRDEEDEEDPYLDLASLLQTEAAQSMGLDGDTIADDQIRSFERYLGKDYGDEAEGQSKVHTREVFETIEWIRPDIARIFAAGPGCLAVEFPDDPSGEKAEQAAEFLYWRIFGEISEDDDEENEGLDLVDSFFFNGALQKIGVIAVDFKDAVMDAPRTFERITAIQGQMLASDPEAGEILSIEPLGEQDEDGEDLYEVRFQAVKEPARAAMKVIAPEDFRVSKRAVSLKRPFYCGYSQRVMIDDVVDMWPDREAEIREAADTARDATEIDERRMARFELDEAGLDGRTETDAGEILLECEYVHYDLDGDGFVELVEAYRIGSLVLEAEEVEENCFASWSPIRIPHKLVGLSIADITMDIQRAQTVLLRAAMDSAQQSVAPRTVAMPGVNLTDLLTVRAGAIIRTKDNTTGKAEDQVHALTVPDLSGSALKMMDKMDDQGERRTGVTRHSQGLNPDVLHKTMGGAALLQNSAAARKEMYARNMAVGLSRAFTKFLRLEIRHGQKRQQIGSGKAMREISLEGWSPKVKVKVHTGQGAGNRETQMMHLGNIGAMQDAFVQRYGDDNPIVTPRHRFNTTEQMTRAMGFASAEAFFADPDKLDDAGKAKLAEMMKGKPDPKTQEAMAKLQAQVQSDMAELKQKQDQFMKELAFKYEKLAKEDAFDRDKLAVEERLAETEIVVDAAQKNEKQSPTGGPNVRTGGDKV